MADMPKVFYSVLLQPYENKKTPFPGLFILSQPNHIITKLS